MQIFSFFPSSSVNLVKFNDASWTLCTGAAANAAETKATARTRHTEPTTLRGTMAWPVNPGYTTQGMLGLHYNPRSPAGGSPLFSVFSCCREGVSTPPVLRLHKAAAEEKTKKEHYMLPVTSRGWSITRLTQLSPNHLILLKDVLCSSLIWTSLIWLGNERRWNGKKSQVDWSSVKQNTRRIS